MKISEHLYDGIPLTVYHQEDGKIKPLIFFFHGFTSDKDKGIMGRGEALANLGFYVVAIDAYLHGKRMSVLEKQRSNISKYEDIIEIAIHTATDAQTLFHKYFKNEKEVNPNAFYAYGVSMGSLSAFYLATIEPKLKAIACLVPTPSFVEYYKDKAATYQFNTGFYFERKLAYYETIDPLIHFEKLKHTQIFMGVGTHDTVVNPIYAQKLKALLDDKTLNLYDTGHISTKEMLEDSYQFLKEVLANDDHR